MKNKILAIILSLSVALSLSACGSSSSSAGGSYSGGGGSESGSGSGNLFGDAYTGTTPEAFDDTAFFNNRRFKKDSATYENVSVSSQSYNAYKSYLKGVSVPYTYEKYYKMQEALAKYEALPELSATQHTNMLKSIDLASLMASVKANNKVYKKEKEKDYTAIFYEELSEEDLKKHCTTIVNTVNYYINEGKVEDINEVKCILGDLKIFEKSVMSNAYVSDDNCLIISPIAETMDIMTIGKDQDNMIATVAHETCHMLQKGCKHNNEVVYAIGHSYKFDEMSIHPLFTNWFYEGAAEKLMVNSTGYLPIVYKYNIAYINSISISVVLNEKRGIYDLEETTFSNSLDALFEVFNCKTEEEKLEILNLMFSLEIIETDDPEFKSAVDPNMSEEKLISIKRELKNSTMLTLSKYFYESLAGYVLENTVGLNDLFYLITVFEHDLNSHITFTNAEKCADAKPFITAYTEIQNKFFEMLAEGSGHTADELAEMFNGYGIVTEDDRKNFTLDSLSKEKRFVFAKTLADTYVYEFEKVRKYN